MNICNDCGNREWFYYAIEATEEVRYNPETGEPIEFDLMDTGRVIGDTTCAECDSTNVRIIEEDDE